MSTRSTSASRRASRPAASRSLSSPAWGSPTTSRSPRCRWRRSSTSPNGPCAGSPSIWRSCRAPTSRPWRPCRSWSGGSACRWSPATRPPSPRCSRCWTRRLPARAVDAMVAAPFQYQRVSSFDEAVRALREHGEEAKVIAGGQSLVPMLNLRVARPDWLIDINPVGAGPIEDLGGYLRLPALTRHRALEQAEVVRRRCPILAAATAFVGNARSRARGTIGGSLAHADPGGELPCVAAALGAEGTVRGGGGARDLAVRELLVSYLTTALEPDEVITEVRVPTQPERSGWSFLELTRRSSDWMVVGVAALVELDTAGAVAGASVGVRSPRPYSVPARTRSPVHERRRQAAGHLHGQRRATGRLGVPARVAARRAQGRARPSRGPLRVRRGRVRDLHGAAGRRGRQRVPAAGGAGGRVLAGDRPRPGRRHRAAPAASELPAQRRGAVRLLHARDAAGGLCAAPARAAAEPRTDPSRADRQPVPLHRLQQDRRRGRGVRRRGRRAGRWLRPALPPGGRPSGSSGRARRTTTSSTRSPGRCSTRPTGSSPACCTARSCGHRCRAPGSPPSTSPPRGPCRVSSPCSPPPTCHGTRWWSAPAVASPSWRSPCPCSPTTGFATWASRSRWSPPSARRPPRRRPS